MKYIYGLLAAASYWAGVYLSVEVFGGMKHWAFLPTLFTTLLIVLILAEKCMNIHFDEKEGEPR